MAQLVKAAPAKLDILSSSSGTHIMGGGDRLPHIVVWPLCLSYGMHELAYTEHKLSKNEKKHYR